MSTNDMKEVEGLPFAREIKLVKNLQANLNTSLFIPSMANTYGTCIEYIRDWFKAGFVDGYFQSEYIDAKNVLDDFKKTLKYGEAKLVKHNKPALSIVARVEQDYNRDTLDMYNYGTNLYYNKCTYKDAFFRNYDKKSFISLSMDQLKVIFSFKVKVSSMSHAQDLFRFIQMRFRSLGTQSRLVDMDFQLPTELMLKVATDNGFAVNNAKVVDQIKFMYFLNQNSQLPITFKLRKSTNDYQYFLKMFDTYLHIRTNEVQVDDGERVGHLMSDYIVEFDAEVLFPSIKFFAYYSLSKQEYIEAQNDDGTYSMYNFLSSKIPLTNEHGWNQYLSTDYIEEELSDKPTIISFKELLGDLRNVIDYTKSQYLSPSLFLDFKLFNDAESVDLEVDWNEYQIKTLKPLKKLSSFIVLYVDLAYMNTTLLNIKGSKDERINYMKSRIVRNDGD